MSAAHIKLLTFKLFKDGAELSAMKCEKINNYLKLLCSVYGLQELLSPDSTILFDCGYFQSGASSVLLQA